MLETSGVGTHDAKTCQRSVIVFFKLLKAYTCPVFYLIPQDVGSICQYLLHLDSADEGLNTKATPCERLPTASTRSTTRAPVRPRMVVLLHVRMPGVTGVVVIEQVIVLARHAYILVTGQYRHRQTM